MKNILLLLFIVLSVSTKAADNYAIGDKLYVWAKKGLNIRMIPSLKGKKIGALQLGTTVTILEKITSPLSVSLDSKNPKASYIKGYWVKVQTGDKIGYVFDAYLLPLKCELKLNRHKNEITHIEPIQIDTPLYKRYDNSSLIDYKIVKTFNEGVIYTIEGDTDKSWNRIEFEGWTAQDAYIFIKCYMYYMEHSTFFKKIAKNEWYSGFENCEWDIKKVGNKIIATGGCFC